jgi:hypothetical protein
MKKRRVVQNAAEEKRAAVGEQLLKQGKQNFEQVYGPKNPGSFNLKEDMAAMKEVKMMTDKQIDHNANAGITSEPFKQEDIAMPVRPATDSKQESQSMYYQVEDESATVPVKSTISDNSFQAQWMTETNGEVPFNEWLDSKKVEDQQQLSEDPNVRSEQVAAMLKKVNPNAPTADTIKAWKQMHGDIFLLDIADRIFIYRYLKRQEWIQMNANPRKDELTEQQVEEIIFDKCVLWPQMDMVYKATMPAGGLSMVVQQIRLQSLFLDPGYVAQMTLKI